MVALYSPVTIAAIINRYVKYLGIVVVYFHYVNCFFFFF
jgi:hypothetical protein